MKIVLKPNLSVLEKNLVLKLWNAEYPAKLTYQSVEEFDTYLSKLLEVKHYLLQDEFEELFGWAITFTRENEKWFAIIVPSKIKNQGFGSQILNQLKLTESGVSGWVIDHNNDLKLDGTTYVSPLQFYVKNGFSICNEIRIETEKISAVKIVWNS